MVRNLILGALIVMSGLGCAARDLNHDVARQVKWSGAGDAKTRVVRGRPYMRADSLVVDQLKNIERTEELGRGKAELRAVADYAYALAEDSVNCEIDHLTDRQLGRLRSEHVGGNSPDNRTAVRDRFWEEASASHRQFVAEIDALSTESDVRRFARRFRRDVRRSPKDQRGQGLLLAMIARSIHEPTGPLPRGQETVDVYRPDEAMVASFANAAARPDEHEQLLTRYAPIIVQERLLAPPYERTADQIGTVELAETQGDVEVVVDTNRPSVYAYGGYTYVGDVRLVQLNYVHWFPEHPRRGASKSDDCGCSGKVRIGADPEAGRIDGGTLRVTLDSTLRPMVIETILNCGCYHRCFPSRVAEERACSDFGPALAGKHFCLERDVPGRIDWALPELIEVPVDRDARPILFSRAGYHGLVAVSFDENVLGDRNVLETKAYRLRPYRELERLPLGNGHGSMFLSNGLVRGAGRLEGKLMAATGMLSAGQPRQRGTQRILWDDYDFDDPHLLEKCLRISLDK